MTKKDYKLVGGVFKDVHSKFLVDNEARTQMFAILVYRLGDVFKEDNPKFDRDKFLDSIFNN